MVDRNGIPTPTQGVELVKTQILQPTTQRCRIIWDAINHIAAIGLIAFSLLVLATEAYAEGQIAFESTRHKRVPQVFVMSEDGREVRQITSKGMTSRPTWYPDGRRLLCVRETPYEVYLIRVYLKGSHRERILPITRGFFYINQPDFSPDGRQIAFLGFKEQDKMPGLYIIDASGKKLHKFIPFATQTDIGPDWSPDGQSIVFSNMDDIFLMDTQTFQVKNVTNSPRQELAATWSPDGAQLAVTSSDGLLLMTPVGEVIKQLTPRKGDVVGVQSWHPDGNRIVFSSPVRPGPRKKPDIYILDLETLVVNHLTKNPAFDQYPAWFDTAFAFSVKPKKQLITIWGGMKTP